MGSEIEAVHSADEAYRLATIALSVAIAFVLLPTVAGALYFYVGDPPVELTFALQVYTVGLGLLICFSGLVYVVLAALTKYQHRLEAAD